jgi:ABC-type branched-subunit amino acid transport system substrate-binding protein
MVGAISRASRKEAMRRFLVLSVVLVAGCANLYSLDDYSTSGEKSRAAASGVDGGSATPVAGDGGQGADIACHRHAECGGGSVCVSGGCVSLANASCPRVFGDATDDHAVILGTILGTGASALERAALLAASELGAVRPLVVVSCDESADVLSPARHLVDDLHVAAIVGPTVEEHVVEATQQVTMKGDTLLMTPTSLVSSLAQLGDNGLTWRNVPSEDQRAKLVIQQISDLEGVLHAARRLSTVKLGVVHRGDDMGQSARDSIAGKLIINGHFIGDIDNKPYVSVDAYGPSDDKAGLAAIAARYASTFVPDVVFITAPEQVDNLIVPLETALTAARALYHPYYVCNDAAKAPAFLDAMASTRMPPDLRRRVRGVGTRPDTTSVPLLSAYQIAFAARYGDGAGAQAAAPAYDAMYAVASAVMAAGNGRLSGTAVARGLRSLGVGNSFNVGPAHVAQVGQALAAGKSVQLRGTSSLMQWDESGDIAAGTVEVWCVGGPAAAPAFGSSGLTMDVETQVIGGAFVQCQ